jgi:hypothetical protein
VSPALKLVVVRFLTAALRAVQADAKPVETALNSAHFVALRAFLPLLPIGDLIALVGGRGTVDNAIDVAQACANIVARAFPPAAIKAEEIWLALEALQFLADAAGVGKATIRIAPGQNPIRGGYEGARGHV